MEGFSELKDLINESNTICLATHKMPDGDAIGSIGAMYFALKNMNKNVYMLIPSRMNKFDFLTGIDEAKKEVPMESYDLLIVLDSSKNDRINMSYEDIKKAKKIAVIDHHKYNDISCDLKIIDENSPANCEVVYKFIKFLHGDITKNVAEYIYLGLMTDTGSFSYERTTGDTYRIAGEMVDLGVDYTKMCKIMRDTCSETRMKLVAYIIDNMEVYMNGKIRYVCIDKSIKEKYNASEEDMDSLVDYLRVIEGTVASIYVKEIDDGLFKVSMRTEEPIDAAVIAAKHNGGGHKRAAGFNTEDVEKTKKELICELERLLESEDNRNT